ncbi:MAG: hypothetical protein ACI8Q1_001120 [Parvicella sp.]
MEKWRLQEKMIKTKILYIFSFMLINVLSFGQTATIKGQLLDKGSYVPSGTITIPEIGHTSRVNSKGEFSIEVPINTNLTFKVNSFGYIKYAKALNLKNGEIRNLKVNLKSSELTEHTVIGIGKDPNPFTERFEPKDASKIPTPMPNLEDQLVATALGVRKNSELSAGYNVRGGNFDENLIYVNGIEIYRPFLARAGQQEGLSFINPYMVDNVVFSAGGFDAKYGDKLSSVMDVTYKDPRKFAATAVTSFTGASLYVQDTINIRSNYLLGARYHTNAYLLGALDTKGEYKPVFIDIQGMYNSYLTDELRLTLYTSYANNKYRVVPENRETNFGSINEALRFTVFYEGQEVTQFETFMSAASLQKEVNKRMKLTFTTSVFKTQETESFDLLGEYRIDELERNLGSDGFGDVAYNRGVGAFLQHARNELDATVFNFYHKGINVFKQEKGSQIKNTLEWGAKYQHELVNDKISEWDYLDSARYNIPHNTDSAGYTDPNAQPYQYLVMQHNLKASHLVSSNRATAYVQHRRNWQKPTTYHLIDSIVNEAGKKVVIDTVIQTNKKFSLGGGIRGHYWDFNNQLVVSPRFNISFKPAWFFVRKNEVERRNMTFKLAAGYYYQPPFYREIRNLRGDINPSIRAQKSLHFVGGMNYVYYMWDRPFKLVSEIYYKHLTDIIPYELDNVRIRYYGENNAKGYATGIDFKINGEFIKDVESFFSLSFLQTKEDILDDFYYNTFNSDGEKIIPGYTPNDLATDSVRIEPGYIPRPTDQFVSFAMMFQDQMPEEWNTEKVRWSTFKVNLNMIFASRLPYGPPGEERYKDTIRSSNYRRVDIGFSKDIIHDHTDRSKFGKNSVLHHVDKMWISLEVFNLLDITNTTNYNWIKDVTGRQYSIPNTLTSRRLNLKLVVQF